MKSLVRQIFFGFFWGPSGTSVIFVLGGGWIPVQGAVLFNRQQELELKHIRIE
jgi:hypothetical protein